MGLPDSESLLEMVPLALVAATDDLVTWANPAAAALFGVPQEELLGLSFLSLLDDLRDPTRRRATLAERGDSAAPLRFVFRARRPDGEVRPAEIEIRVLKATRPGRRLLVSFRDLSRRQEEQDLVAALIELAAQLRSIRSMEALFQVVADGLVALGLSFTVLKLTPERGLQVIFSGLHDELRARLRGALGENFGAFVSPLASVRYAQEAISTGRTFFEEDVLGSAARIFAGLPGAQREQVVDAHRASRLVRGVVAPIMLHSGPFGIVTCGGERLTSGDSAALALFFAQMSSALESILSVQRLERRNQELEWLRTVTEVSQRPSPSGIFSEIPGGHAQALLRITAEATRSDIVSLVMLDAEHDLLHFTDTCGAMHPLAPSLTTVQLGEWMRSIIEARSSRACASADLPGPAGAELLALGIEHVAGVAMHVRDRAVGALLLHRRGGGAFTPEELVWAETVARQVAVQLESRRLQDETAGRAQDLALINELGSVITQSLELTEVLATGVENLAALLGVDAVFLLLLDGPPEAQTLTLAASAKKNDAQLGGVLPFERPSLLARALDERRPIVTDHPGRDPRANPRYVSFLDVESVLLMPLFARSRPLGFVVVGEDRPGHSFGPSAVDRAYAVTNQLGTAIANAQLFESERKRAEQLGSFLEVSRVVTASLELSEILTASSSSLASVVGASNAFVWLLDRDGSHLRGAESSDPALRALFRESSVPVSGRSAGGMAVRSREPVRIFDTRANEVIEPFLNERFQMRSLLAIPLLVRDEPIGAVIFGDKRAPRRWTDAEVERGTLMSRQVAVAVTNARLFEDLRQSYNELARTQEALLRRERLAALGELSAVMAHEVRNPLGVIFNALGGLGKLLKPLEGDAALLFGMLGEEADRLDRIVGDLLDFARPKDPDFRPESLEELVAGALEAAARVGSQAHSHIEVRIAIAPDLPRIPLDPRMMRQALVNLIINAVQAMDKEGGTLDVSAVVKRIDGQPNIELSVQDTGPGINPEVAARIFEPFFTTKAAGTGLGLSVVKHIVEAHRGRVHAEPRKPRGTSFVVTLPLEQPLPGR